MLLTVFPLIEMINIAYHSCQHLCDILVDEDVVCMNSQIVQF